MSKNNLIGIHMDSVSTDMNYFTQTGIYRTVPQVIYTINDEKPREFHINRPIEIFHKNMHYRELGSIIKDDGGNADFMAIPRKAYQKMQYYINKNVEKVLADMVTSVIVNAIQTLGSDADNVFFINNRDSDKLIGRLGYMYLDSSRNTFCFVTYKPDRLLTNAMRNGSDILEFDIEYFQNNIEKDVSEIVPNDFMESMTQTVFYKMLTREGELTPLRCDIFSQGISNRDIKEKVDLIRDILSDSKNLSLPFEESGSGNGRYVRIPQVLSESIEASKHYRYIVDRILESSGDMSRGK